MKKVPFYFPLVLAFFALVFLPVFFPYFRVAPFAPLLALAYYRYSLLKSLWIAFGCGLLLDLLGSSHFGLLALSFTASSTFLYLQKRHFFEDKPVAFSLFSAFISSCIGAAHLISLYLFDKTLMLDKSAALIELIAMPSLDGLFAFVWFTCPMKLYTYIQKVGWKRLFERKEKDEQE